MSSETSSKTKWFIVALIGTMILCFLCIGAAIGAAWLGFNAFEQSGLSDVILETEEPTREPSISPSEPPRNLGRAYEMLEELTDTIVPINSPIELAERLGGIPNVPEVVAENADAISIGSVKSFWAANLDTISHFQLEAELVYARPHVYFWIQDGAKYDLEDVEALVDTFEDEIYPTTREFFGSEWSPGVDGDDHLYILYAKNLGAVTAGYFSPSDEFSPLAHEYSNAHEMFYLSADVVDLGERYAYSVLAHEFQHMIHWNLDRNEQSWINEGFSELSAHLSGYDVGGWDYAYADDPDIALTEWPTNGGTHYGQAFLYVTYFLDRFGSEATQAVVAHVDNGLDSIDTTLQDLGILDPQTGEPITADQVHKDWIIAMYLQDQTVDDGRYAYRSYTPPMVSTSDEFDECPVTAQDRQVNQYGVDYIDIYCEGEYTLSFKGASEVPVLPAEPISGEYAFWSNRGDESDMTLTRAFDLTSVEGQVKMRYWVWYDIEEGWDYLYLVISPDGGETWEIVQTPSGTDEDTSGSSYGWAYTGYSGGGQEPVWIQEKVDLSEYAGQEILVRFEYITDAAVNGDGLLLDDLSIKAIDYFEGFEEIAEGWEAQGFVRLYNRLPQTYQVILLERDGEWNVREIQLDQDNKGEISFSVTETSSPATLIVSGTTRHTWQPAAYTIEILP
jgi:immune inhibitor A